MKKSVILVVISLLLLIAGGCKKDNSDVIIDLGVSILYKDNLGNNLLDSASPNHYSIANMHIFYLENCVKEEYYNGKMDEPKGLRIIKNATGQYVLAFGFCGPAVNDTTTNFLQLSDTDTDTLVGTLDHSNGVVLKKAWYNGVLWKPGASPNFIIVKK